MIRKTSIIFSVFIAILFVSTTWLYVGNETLQKQVNNLEGDKYNLQKRLIDLANQLDSQIMKYQNYLETHTYTDLEYNEIKKEIGRLQAQYDLITQPLAFEIIPSIQELEEWLNADSTDSFTYTMPNFICGDFAVTLAIHAKEMNWDMGVVAIYGYDESYESYAHAINTIITAEGLVYIEPQNDYTWYYRGHEAIHNNAWFEINRAWIYVEIVSNIVWYT